VKVGHDKIEMDPDLRVREAASKRQKHLTDALHLGKTGEDQPNHGTYEPRHPNDRLLLGMKGTMSELELSLLRARSMEALKQKARRGELFFTVAVG
jgi:hypothetical protein